MSDVLRKALDQTSGGALSPESLEPALVERVKELSPALRMFNVTQANGAAHTFKARTALPTALFEGENTSTVASNSTYTSVPVPLKIIRAKGKVTGFTQSASAGFIDAYATELDGTLMAVQNTIDFGILWGNSGHPLMFDGLDKVANTNLTQVDAAATIADLDTPLDLVIGAGYDRPASNLVYFMSPQMKSKLARAESRINFVPTKVSWAGGVEMDSYRGVPIMVSSRCKAQTAMGTVSAATATTGGALPDSTTYYYQVAYVNTLGESVACAEVSQATGSSGGAHKNTLSWTAVAGARYYKIYIGTTSGACKLSAVIAAKAYDANYDPTGDVTSWVHDKAITAGKQTPLKAGHEVVFLGNTDADVFELAGLRDQNGNALNNLITYLPLAVTGDSMDFMVKSYLTSVPKIEGMVAYTRGLKLA